MSTHNKTSLETNLENIFEEVIFNDEIKSNFKEIQEYSTNMFKKIEDSNPALLPIVKKLFKIIPSNQLGLKENLYLPKKEVKLTAFEMIILYDNGIELSYHRINLYEVFIQHKPKKYKKIKKGFFGGFNNKLSGILLKMQGKKANKNKLNVQQIVGDVVNKYYITIKENKNGQTKIIPSKDWNQINVKVCLNYIDIYKKYKELDQAMQDIFASITKDEWGEKIEVLEKEIKEEVDKNLKMGESFGKKNFGKQNFIIPEEESIFDSLTLNVGKKSISKNSEKIINMQKSGQVPSIFNSSSLELLKDKQNVVILIDTSLSTETYDAFKLIDLAAVQAQQFIYDKIGKNITIEIINYSNKVHNVFSKLDHFLYPNGGTSTEIALLSSILYFRSKILETFNTTDFKKNSRELNNSIKNDPNYKGFDDSFIDSLFNNTEDINLIENKTPEISKTKEEEIQDIYDIISKYLDKKIIPEFKDSHIILITDGISNKYNDTIASARILGEMQFLFSQIVMAYDLNDVDKAIQSSIFEELGGDNLKDMANYEEDFEKVAKEANGNSFTIWLNDKLAHLLVSMMDISLGLGYAKKKGLLEDENKFDK